MTKPSRIIDTGISSSRAVLTPPPAQWSYSALVQAEACPLRYCLERAIYPDLDGRKGYPSLPSVPAMLGNIVHGALETVVKAMADAGVDSPQAEVATKVIRSLGGLTGVIEAELERQMASLANNARISKDRQRRIALDLEAKISDVRAQVQTYLSRTAFVSGTARVRGALDGSQPRTPERYELREGSHAEVELVAEELRFRGRVDLLTISGDQVAIVDYKTGSEADAHADQLRLYALLWSSDHAKNPRRIPVASLTAAYRDHDTSVDVPSDDDLATYSVELAARIVVVDREISSGTATAKPNQDNCRFCPVRHLCTSYWTSVAPQSVTTQRGDFFDYEGVIGEKNGQRSWWLLNDTGDPELLLRTMTPTPPFEVGDRVRLLGLRHDNDPELELPIGSLTVATEVFQMQLS